MAYLDTVLEHARILNQLAKDVESPEYVAMMEKIDELYRLVQPYSTSLGGDGEKVLGKQELKKIANAYREAGASAEAYVRVLSGGTVFERYETKKKEVQLAREKLEDTEKERNNLKSIDQPDKNAENLALAALDEASKEYRAQLTALEKELAVLEQAKKLPGDPTKEKDPEEEKQFLEVRGNLAASIRTFIREDMEAILEVGNLPEGTATFDRVTTCSGVQYHDVTEQEKKIFGDALSSRISMTLPINGKETEGFFTANSVYHEDVLASAYEDCIRRYPKYAEFFNIMRTEPEYAQKSPADLRKLFSVWSFVDQNGEIDTFAQRNLLEKVTPKLSLRLGNCMSQILREEHSDFPAVIYGFMNRLRVADADKNINGTLLGLKNGDNIDKRNCAMTAVANLLGKDHLLAKSIKMNVRDGNRVIEGTFMEKASGVDIKHVRHTDPVLYADKNALESPELFRSVADLQVLDYVCGNVDRHHANFLYQFKVTPKGIRMTGIQGIDNDSSFCRLNTVANRSHHAAPIRCMKVIDARTAESVLNLNESTLSLVLQKYDLPEFAVKAAWSRTRELQEAILQKKIRVMEDKDWEKAKLSELTNHVPGTQSLKDDNLFDTVEYGFHKMQQDFHRDVPAKNEEKNIREIELRGNYRSIVKTLTDLGAELKFARSVFHNSGTYRKLVSKTEAFVKKHNALMQKGNYTPAQFRRSLDQLHEITQLAQTYINNKTEPDSNGLVEKADISDTTRNKLGVVRQLKDYLDNKFTPIAEDEPTATVKQMTALHDDYEKYAKEERQYLEEREMFRMRRQSLEYDFKAEKEVLAQREKQRQKAARGGKNLPAGEVKAPKVEQKEKPESVVPEPEQNQPAPVDVNKESISEDLEKDLSDDPAQKPLDQGEKQRLLEERERKISDLSFIKDAEK